MKLDCFPTRNEYLEQEGVDIFEEILPEDMTYEHILDEDFNHETRSYKDFFKEGMIIRFGDRVINFRVDYWMQKRKTLFTPTFLSEIGKMYSIYQQDREYSINYADYTSTVESEKTQPHRNAGVKSEQPTTRDKVVNRFIQEAGPLGNADMIRNSMNAIEHPFERVYDLMETWFINEHILEMICC